MKDNFFCKAKTTSIFHVCAVHQQQSLQKTKPNGHCTNRQKPRIFRQPGQESWVPLTKLLVSLFMVQLLTYRFETTCLQKQETCSWEARKLECVCKKQVKMPISSQTRAKYWRSLCCPLGIGQSSTVIAVHQLWTGFDFSCTRDHSEREEG